MKVNCVIQASAEGRGLGMKNRRKGIARIMCVIGGQIPVVCLSVCRTTPPSWLDQSTSNFQGMLGAILAVHISKMSMI